MFPRTTDQLLFEETTKKFLAAECSLDDVRELGNTSTGYEAAYWKRGAELGWTSLVVPEEAGGGSVSDQGVKDLALVAFQFGRHAAPGPLLGCNVVAAALGRWGSAAQQGDPLAELIGGEETGAWAFAESPPNDTLGTVVLQATPSGNGYVLHGSKAPVESGLQAKYFLVTARSDQGLSQFLVPADTAGLQVTPLHSLDMTKRFAHLKFDHVFVPGSSLIGEAGQAGPTVEWLTDLAATIQLAEMCGAMQWAFDTTLEWSFNRYSFGRPLASYQEIKHRFADMKLWLEASIAVSAQAADAVDRDSPERSEIVSAGKFYVGQNGLELLQDCVQMHGGIGITFDHHLHMFLRRVAVNATLFGTPSQHAARLTDMQVAKEVGA